VYSGAESGRWKFERDSGRVSQVVQAVDAGAGVGDHAGAAGVGDPAGAGVGDPAGVHDPLVQGWHPVLCWCMEAAKDPF